MKCQGTADTESRWWNGFVRVHVDAVPVLKLAGVGVTYLNHPFAWIHERDIWAKRIAERFALAVDVRLSALRRAYYLDPVARELAAQSSDEAIVVFSRHGQGTTEGTPPAS